MKRRVVVTGLGLVTPCGHTVADTWSALMAGRSGVGYIEKFDTTKFSVKIAAEVKGFDPLKFVEKKEARKMGSFIHYAIAATDEAIYASGLIERGQKIADARGEEVAERAGTYISSGIGDFWAIEREHEKLLNEGPGRVSPFFIPSAIVNLAAGQVSIRFGAKGPNSATATACSAGAHAIGDSFKIIQRGDADVMICGGAESAITPMSVAGFAAMRALSTRNDDPEHASRPFDRERDGFVMGEGSAVVVLEEYDRAVARGAPIYAEVAGFGMTNDAYHMTAPLPDGAQAARSMRLALRDAGVGPGEIGYVNAHGSSTPLNDPTETVAIKQVFGERAYRLPVSGTKGYYGHALGASGAIEVAICAQAIAGEWLPPTVNLAVPDASCDLDYIPGTGRPARVEHVLSNSFGFGGVNAAVVMRRVV